MRHLLTRAAICGTLAAAGLAVSATAHAAGGQSGQAASQEEEGKKLELGDKAPKLMIGEWVKGEPIEKIEEGQVYVVEFWATWCGPCIAGMPHVSELQEKYEDDVKIIGVNIWDDPTNVEPFMKGEGDYPNGDELMSYRVAIEEKNEDGNVRQGKMSESWMSAAGRGGIPSAFIVDKQRRIAWMGHPMSMDMPLEMVVKGTWDLEKYKTASAKADELQQQAQTQARSQQFEQAAETVDELIGLWPEMYGPQFATFKVQMLMQAGKSEEAMQFANEAVDAHLWDNAQALNAVAWGIATTPAEPRDLRLALRAAERANELSEGENPNILDTVARVHFEMGDVDRAIEIQRDAIEKAEGRMQQQFEQTLAQYEAERGGG